MHTNFIKKLNEKLIVKNFGPIKHVELDIKKVNVIIGEQGTGKSALVRLLNLLTSEGFLFGDGENKETLIERYGFFFINDTFINLITKNYEIVYEHGMFSIVFNGPNQEISERFFDISQNFFVRHDFKLEGEYYALKKWFSENIGGASYIPAERIALNTVGRKFSHGSPDKGNLDQYYIDFANRYYQARSKIKELKIPFLDNVTYRFDGIDDKVIFKNENLFLYQASSGFQASIPLSVFIEYFTSIEDKIRFIIEEPELNLFPATQNKLIKYLIDKTNIIKNSLFFATHSPYILTSLNNMMYAYQVGQIHPEKISKEIDKKYWLNPDDVSAYMMKPDGSFENILDEDGLIKAEKIDEVSKAINKEFNKIMDIELGVDEATK